MSAEHLAAHTDLEALVTACEIEFTSDITESGEHPEPDDSMVMGPRSAITFGMIRRARAALDSMRPVVDSDNIDGYDEGLPE